MSAQQFTEDLINKNKVVLFTKSYCPYCKKAKALLDELKVQYEFVDLDLRDDGAEIQNYLLEKTGQRTVPNIFINQKHLGGSDDLAKANQSGELATLLN